MISENINEFIENTAETSFQFTTGTLVGMLILFTVICVAMYFVFVYVKNIMNMREPVGKHVRFSDEIVDTWNINEISKYLYNIVKALWTPSSRIENGILKTTVYN